jgi:phosphoribosylglycinamide formyltransferase 2
MFIQGDDVIFSEVSPRPHDTGMVTTTSSRMPTTHLWAHNV